MSPQPTPLPKREAIPQTAMRLVKVPLTGHPVVDTSARTTPSELTSPIELAQYPQPLSPAWQVPTSGETSPAQSPLHAGYLQPGVPVAVVVRPTPAVPTAAAAAPVAKPSSDWRAKLGTALGAVDLRDKLLKLIVYVIRLLRHFEALVPLAYNRVVAEERLKRLDKNIVDARQLLNHFGYLETGQAFLELYKAKDMDPLKRAAMVVRTGFWTIEQCSSDATYYAKHLFHHWNKDVPAWYYRFGKSMSLTILILVDLREMAITYGKLRAARAAADPKAELIAKYEAHIKKLRLGIFRCVCDCIIYYSWVKRYNPNKGFTLICGLCSALVGVYLQSKKYL